MLGKVCTKRPLDDVTVACSHPTILSTKLAKAMPTTMTVAAVAFLVALS